MESPARWMLAWVAALAACAQTTASVDSDTPIPRDASRLHDARADLASVDALAGDAVALDAGTPDAVMDSQTAFDARDLGAVDRPDDVRSEEALDGARDAPADVSDVFDSASDGADACPGVDLRRDPRHCGGCGVRCCGGWCFDGVCGTEGPPGTIGCPTRRTDCVGPSPVQPAFDPNHCGGCGIVCPTGAFCAAGACVCGVARPVCGGVCVDALNDSRHCGACDRVCCAGEICSGGACSVACATGRSSCPRPTGGCLTCVDLSTDRANCGMCRNACAAEWSCVEGRCVAPARDGGCPSPHDAGAADAATCCGGESVNVATEPTTGTVQGVAWAAYDYVPSCDYDVTRLEIHTRDGEVALLEDACDEPGRLLFRGTVSGTGDISWKGAPVTPPIHLTAGRRYWIATHLTICSFARDGLRQAQRGAPDLAGPWEGPYRVHAFTFHALGRCL